MSVDWLLPWHPVTNDEDRRALLSELRRELRPDHPLSQEEVMPIARRQDCDDVLFSMGDGRVAIVHLTWSGKADPVSDFPWTTVFASLNQFIVDAMKPDHRDWAIADLPLDSRIE